MPLHPVLREKLNAALLPGPAADFTPRDATLLAGAASVHRLAQDLKAQGPGVAEDALHAMVGHLEDAFLIRGVSLATDSERRRNSNPRKFYPVDTGLVRAFDTSGRTNTGQALETAVLHELDRRKADTGYVRTTAGFEVDFHARYREGGEELIQVCADPGDAETLARELRALEDAVAEHPRAKRRLLTLTFDQVPARHGGVTSFSRGRCRVHPEGRLSVHDARGGRPPLGGVPGRGHGEACPEARVSPEYNRLATSAPRPISM